MYSQWLLRIQQQFGSVSLWLMLRIGLTSPAFIVWGKKVRGGFKVHTIGQPTDAAEGIDAGLGAASFRHAGSEDLDSVVSAAPDQYQVSGSLFDRLLRAAWQNQLNRCK